MAKGGKTLNDRVLAAAVRQLGLRRIKKQFEEEPDSEFSKQLLLKLAPTLLPRLNEHTGEDGEKLFPKPLLAGKSNVSSNHSTNETLST